MEVTVLKSKIHRARVTGAKIHYMGSITIDSDIINHAKILPYEKVLVVSIDSGERLETYVIEGKKGSKEICLNGAAARKILEGDRVIIMSFAAMKEKEAKTYKPKIVTMDKNNNIIDEEYHVEKDDQC